MGNVRDAITTRLTHDVLSNKETSDIGYNILKGIPTEELNRIKEELTPWLVNLGWLWDMFGHFIIAYFVIKILIRLVLLLLKNQETGSNPWKCLLNKNIPRFHHRVILSSD